MSEAGAIRTALAEVSQPEWGDDWHREHKGELRDIVAEAWWCGDDYCNCTQALIVARFENAAFQTSHLKPVVRVTLWHGEFAVEGEGHAEDDLIALRSRLAADAPDLVERIAWPAWAVGQETGA